MSKIKLYRTHAIQRIDKVMCHPAIIQTMRADGAKWTVDFTNNIYLIARNTVTQKDVGLIIFEPFIAWCFSVHMAILPEYQGRFISYKAAREGIQWAKVNKGINQLAIFIPEHSLPARRAAERLGFTITGQIPCAVSMHGIMQAICIYSLLASQ
jgi:RimJ/RimL family protein N-acetyltransferase